MIEDSYECPLCGGPIGLLGTLGNTEHFRCCDCGAEFSQNRGAQHEQA